MSIASIAAKTAGGVGLALVAYDSHCQGRIEADSYQKKQDAAACCDSYLNSRSMTRASTLESGIKKTLFNFELDNNIRGFGNSIAGYAKGFGTMFASDIVPAALATVALATKGVVSKASAIGLAAYGAVFALQDILGVGNKKYL